MRGYVSKNRQVTPDKFPTSNPSQIQSFQVNLEFAARHRKPFDFCPQWLFQIEHLQYDIWLAVTEKTYLAPVQGLNVGQNKLRNSDNKFCWRCFSVPGIFGKYISLGHVVSGDFRMEYAWYTLQFVITLEHGRWPGVQLTQVALSAETQYETMRCSFPILKSQEHGPFPHRTLRTS